MTDHASFSNEQWASLIASTASAVKAAPRPARKATDFTPKELAKTIDHTLLKLNATEDQVVALCREAREWGFKTVCVRLPFVELARRQLEGSRVGVTCVVGFHEGSCSTGEKLSEARTALAAGATELDVVLNHALFSHHASTPDYSAIFHELAALRALAPPDPASSGSSTVEAGDGGKAVTFKLILETAALHDYAAAEGSGGEGAEKTIIAATVLAHHAGFDFVKTSTGFYVPDPELAQLGGKPRPTGATTEDVALMRATCLYLYTQDQAAQIESRVKGQGEEKEERRRAPMKVKASGGIRTLSDARAMVEAGAERLGVSAGVGICREAEIEAEIEAGMVGERQGGEASGRDGENGNGGHDGY